MTEHEYWYTRYAEEQQFREEQHAATTVNIEKQFGYWQLCPMCGGWGEVRLPETLTPMFGTCPVCNGSKAISKT